MSVNLSAAPEVEEKSLPPETEGAAGIGSKRGRGRRPLPVLEKHYSLAELCVLCGFSERFWRERAQRGELTLRTADGYVVAEPAMIAGELRIPASGVNAFLAAHRYQPGVGLVARQRQSGRFRAA